MTTIREHIQKRVGALFNGESDNIYVKVGIAVVLVVFIAMMFPHGESTEHTYVLGSVWAEQDVVAPFAFPIYKNLRVYEKERLDAARSVFPVFERNETVEKTQLDHLQTLWNKLQAATDAHRLMTKSSSMNDSLEYRKAIKSIPFTCSDKQLIIIDNIERHQHRFVETQHEILTDILSRGILDWQTLKLSDTIIALRKGTSETLLLTKNLYTVHSALEAFEHRMNEAFKDSEVKEIGRLIAHAVLKPNVLLSVHATNQSIQLAVDNVPRTLGYVLEHETIIRKNDRITEEAKLKLESYERSKIERGAQTNEWRHWLGIVLHVMLLLGIYGFYLYVFRKKIFYNDGKLAIIAMLLLMESYVAYLSLQLDLNLPLQYLIVVPAASMLLTIIFDSRVGFYGTVTIAFMIAAIRGNDYSIAIISFVAGTLGSYTVRDIRHRTQIFRSVIFVFLGYALSITALSIERFETLPTTLTALTFAFANSVISTVLTYGLLLLFERVFGVTTDLTLQELSNFNHPLLRELSEKAPGTFHHSVTIGTLAESAAEAIGANAILARVGSYYHDIGKMQKPEYFMENLAGSPNKHNRLKPRMSALIIAAHVKEGIELGRERGLPKVILDFIPQHHGTTRISYFFDKALKQAVKRPPKGSINEADYRYPGPKPQTKETGIVMLADSVEATTRALEELTPHKLELTIDTTIKKRFLEGQLDECELTLRDLSNIREAFLKILLGVHHQRIQYPAEETHQLAEQEDKLEDVAQSVVSEEEVSSEHEIPSVPPAGQDTAEGFSSEHIDNEQRERPLGASDQTS